MDDIPKIKGVIVAEDDALLRGILRSKLEAIGLTVFVAANGLEAVEFASRMQPTLIMLDLNMPRLNGLLACERIRRMAHNQDTPILVLTSAHTIDAERAARAVGVTEYLKKPYRPAELLDALSRCLSMDPSARRILRGDADRAAEIAQIARLSNADNIVARDGPDRQFDSSKHVLNVLRRS